MKITQAIKMAFASICSTKLRSFLTMLGIIIGVMSVTVLVSIVQSTTNNVSDTLSQLGGNVISATVTSRRSNKIYSKSIWKFIQCNIKRNYRGIRRYSKYQCTKRTLYLRCR